MDRRRTTSRLGSAGETSRVPVIDYAPTRVFRQGRQGRTPGPVPAPAPAVPQTATPPASARTLAPPTLTPAEAALGVPAHPRLVRRPRATPAPPPSMTLPRVMLRAESRDPDDLDDQPTGEITATRPRPRPRKRVYR